MPDRIRLLPFATASGPLNMGRDEAILEAVASGESPPTLRLYGWRGDWLSIGLAEAIADVDLVAARAQRVGVLRRPSGGTAVLHRGQVAWSLSLPADHPLAPGDIVESYRLQAAVALDLTSRLGVAARAVSAAEARLPLPDPILSIACFGGLAPHEVVVGEPPRKLIGWGQVRRRGVVMHHATLSRRFDAAALSSLLNADRPRLAGALDARVTDLRQAAGRVISVGALTDALVQAHRAAGLCLEPGDMTAPEQRRARELVRTRYGADGWTTRR